MSLAMDVLRLVTIKALRGRTDAGLRVFDSPAEPADIRLREDRAPYIAVYTDDADLDLDRDSLLSATVTAFLVIEVAAAERVTYERQNTDQDPSDPDMDTRPSTFTVTEISSTDEGLEMQIGFIAHQAKMALVAQDNPWADLWRILTSPGRRKIEVRRGGSGQSEQQEGPRHAARVMRIALDILNEPTWGEAIDPDGFWGKFFALGEDDPEIGGIVRMIRAHIDRPEGAMPEWIIGLQQGSTSEQAARGIGISPVISPELDPHLSHAATVTDEKGGYPVRVDEGPGGSLDHPDPVWSDEINVFGPRPGVDDGE